MPHLRRSQADGINVHLELSGKRAINFFRFQGIPAAHTYTHFEEKPTFEEVDVLATRLLSEYIAGKIDRVDVAYMKFLNAARQAGGGDAAAVVVIGPASRPPRTAARGSPPSSMSSFQRR